MADRQSSFDELAEAFFEQSNIRRFLDHLGISDYEELLGRSAEDPIWYWSSFERYFGLKWTAPYESACDDPAGPEWAKWFVGGEINAGFNCLDRQIELGRGDKPAYICEDESGAKEIVTYSTLARFTNQLANALGELGVKAGDRVCIYMSNTWRAVAIMLACAKSGAIHSVIFSGLGSMALRTRIEDADPKVIFVSNSYSRRGKLIRPIFELEEALKNSNRSRAIIVDSNRALGGTSKKAGTLFDLREVTESQPGRFSFERTSSEDPLFILHTSGTTGKPKAVVHCHAGFAVVSAEQTLHPLDLKERDILFWPTDLAWISAHIWLVYGLLLNGGTAVLYDGAIDHPSPNRIYDIIRENAVTILGFSATGLRTIRKNATKPIAEGDLASLRLFALTGEPIDGESWKWMFENLGRSRVPIFNNSGGTEIGGAILGAVPYLPMKQSSVGRPLPGFDADVLDDDGKRVRGQPGYLVVKKPWPSMTRGLWKNPETYLGTYWSKYTGIWYHGDWAQVDDEGYWFILGRADDVIKVSGHRIGAAEVEDVLLAHPDVAEAAVVARPDQLRGQTIAAFVVQRNSNAPLHNRRLSEELKEFVASKLGRIARPDSVQLVSSLPKTQTGKIIRRQLRQAG